MDNWYVRGLRIQQKSVVKRLYAAICMLLVSSLLISVSSYAWLVLSQAPEVIGVTTTVGANGSLEIALNANGLDAEVFSVNEASTVGVTSAYEKNTRWGNIIDLSDERYGLQDVDLKPAALNCTDDGGGTLDLSAPVAFANYGEDGRVKLIDSLCEMAAYNSSSAIFSPTSQYGLRTAVEYVDEQEAVSALQDIYGEFANMLDNGNLAHIIYSYGYYFDPYSRVSSVIEIDEDILTKLRGADMYSERTEAGLLYELEQVLTQAEEDYLASGAKSLEGTALEEQRELLNQLIADTDTCAATCAEIAKDAAPDDNLEWSILRGVLDHLVDYENMYNSGGRQDNYYSHIEIYRDNVGILNRMFQMIYVGPAETVKIGEGAEWFQFESTGRNELVAALYRSPYDYSSYAFCVDLLFRTNAENANLLLQTEGIDRIYNGDNAPDDWNGSDEYEDAQGQGSRITLENEDLRNAIRVAFVDTVTGEIYGTAKADAQGYLHLVNDTQSAVIRPLDTNVVTALTVWVYLDGEAVQNAHVSIVDGTELKVNLQFATDTVLYPAFGKHNEANGGTQVPSTPTGPTETTDFYVESNGGDQYSFYTLNTDGSREYELAFTGSMDADAQAVVVEEVTAYPDGGVAIPAVATCAMDNEAYSVAIDPTAPFANLGNENAAVFFVPVDGEKVGITSADLSDLFKDNAVTAASLDSSTMFTSLDLSGLDTSAATDMSYMFHDHANLTNVNLDGVDTGNVTDMTFMFGGCSSLGQLDVSGFDTANVTYMSNMFSNCYSLTELDVSGFDTVNVTSMSHVFYKCSSLTELDVSGFDTANVTQMLYLFGDCSGLTELDVSGFSTANVTNMAGMFYGCSGLTELDVSGFDTASVTSMVSMFSDCSGLTKLDVDGFDTTNVTGMGLMFCDCSGLTELDVNGFDTTNVIDMQFMFSGCSGLTELDVSGFDTANVTSMVNMFSDCSGLTKLDINGFDTVNVTDMKSMFGRCSSLTELDVSGFDTSSVTDMSHMFFGCSDLTELSVSGFDTENVTNMQSMFYNCYGLNELDVSGFNTANVTNMKYMFANCYLLYELNLSSFDMSNVENTGDFLTQCTNLQTIVTPKVMSATSIALPTNYVCKADGNVYTLIDSTTPTQAVLKVDNDLSNYVYVDGNYTASAGTDGDIVYTYTVIMADETRVTMSGAADLRAGIYTFGSDNGLATAISTDEITVGTIDGTTYELGTGNFKTVNDSSVIVLAASNSALVTGAKAVYIEGGENVVSLIFVTEAA